MPNRLKSPGTIPNHCGQRMDPGNLRWATPRQNCADRKLHGTQVRGTRVNTNKLSENDVRSILKKVAKGSLPKTVADHFGVHVSSVHQMVRGDTWKHVDRSSL